MAETAIAKLDTDNYLILQPDIDVGEVLEINLAGEELSARDLPQIKVPAGGVTTWSVPMAGDYEETKEIKGIVAYTEMQRVFWMDDYTGGNTPPDCFSPDGKVGVGNPGGSCKSCVNARFSKEADGSAGAQPCQARRLMFVVTADSVLPYLLSVPPSSLKEARAYLLALAGLRLPIHHVQTSITLTKDRNAKGIEYSKIRFGKPEPVTDPGKLITLDNYVAAMKESLQGAAVDAAATGEGAAYEASDDPIPF